MIENKKNELQSLINGSNFEQSDKKQIFDVLEKLTTISDNQLKEFQRVITAIEKDNTEKVAEILLLISTYNKAEVEELNASNQKALEAKQQLEKKQREQEMKVQEASEKAAQIAKLQEELEILKAQNLSPDEYFKQKELIDSKLAEIEKQRQEKTLDLNEEIKKKYKEAIEKNAGKISDLQKDAYDQIISLRKKQLELISKAGVGEVSDQLMLKDMITKMTAESLVKMYNKNNNEKDFTRELMNAFLVKYKHDFLEIDGKVVRLKCEENYNIFDNSESKEKQELRKLTEIYAKGAKAMYAFFGKKQITVKDLADLSKDNSLGDTFKHMFFQIVNFFLRNLTSKEQWLSHVDCREEFKQTFVDSYQESKRGAQNIQMQQ